MNAGFKGIGSGRTPGNAPGDANRVSEVYKRLLVCHGPQGWWPIVNRARGTGEYHVKAPRSGSDFFEIAIGAILTQNIAWKNVDSSLAVLKKKGLLEPGKPHETRHRAPGRPGQAHRVL